MLYAIFAADNYYPLGGIYDLQGIFDDYKKAEKKAINTQQKKDSIDLEYFNSEMSLKFKKIGNNNNNDF